MTKEEKVKEIIKLLIELDLIQFANEKTNYCADHECI